MNVKMKKYVYIALSVIIIACSLFIPTGAASAAAKREYIKADAAKAEFYLTDFIETNGNKDRTLGTIGEGKAAVYLAEKFEEIGLEPYFNPVKDSNKFFQTTKVYDIKKQLVDSQNVVGYIPAKNGGDETVVIGAHYDNVYGYTDSQGTQIGGEGAYDNGTGVATMLSVADTLAAAVKGGETFNFNIVFVAFGAEELKMEGSKLFVDKMIAEKSKHFENLLVMYNLDVVSGGDYIYLYTDEVETEHGEFMYEIASDLQIELKRPPLDKKIILASGFYDTLPYSHVGQMSDHTNFYNQGKNVLFFFSINWNTPLQAGTVESTRHDSVMHTKNDTLANLKANHADSYVKYMNNISNLVLGAISQQDEFVTVMKSAMENRVDYSFWTNSTWMMLIYIGVLILIIGGVVLMYYKYKKKAPIPPPTTNTKVYTKPVSVFGDEFEGEKKSGDPFSDEYVDNISDKKNDFEDPFGF